MMYRLWPQLQFLAWHVLEWTCLVARFQWDCHVIICIHGNTHKHITTHIPTIHRGSTHIVHVPTIHTHTHTHTTHGLQRHVRRIRCSTGGAERSLSNNNSEATPRRKITTPRPWKWSNIDSNYPSSTPSPMPCRTWGKKPSKRSQPDTVLVWLRLKVKPKPKILLS